MSNDKGPEQNPTRIVIPPSPDLPTPSFPQGQVHPAEREWTNSFLAQGNCEEQIISFERRVTSIHTRQLQLLRKETSDREEKVLWALGTNLNKDLVLNFLRNRFQSDALYYEESVRDGDEREKISTDGWLELSRKAYQEMDRFDSGRTKSLVAVRRLISAEYNLAKESAQYTDNAIAEHFGEEDYGEAKSKRMVHESLGRVILWEALKGFVDNLELKENPKAEL